MFCLDLVLKLNTKRDNWGIYSSSLFSDGLLQWQSLKEYGEYLGNEKASPKTLFYAKKS